MQTYATPRSYSSISFTFQHSRSVGFPFSLLLLYLSNRNRRFPVHNSRYVQAPARGRTKGPAASDLGRILQPLPILLWGPSALDHLGVPIVVGVSSFSSLSSLTPADCVRRFTASHYRGPRRRLSGGSPKITRLAFCLYCA